MNDDLNKVPSQQPAKKAEQYFFRASSADFKKIPGSPIAYWVSDVIRDIFYNAPSLKQSAFPRQGLATTNNDLFLRRWFEVDVSNTGYKLCKSEAINSKFKWFPINKGGQYRRWYGNNEFVVNYENDGKTICDYIDNTPGVRVKSNGRVINRDRYFQEGITWSTISSGKFSMRYSPPGSLFETKGAMCFCDNNDYLLSVLAYMNTNIVAYLLRAISPTLDFHEGPLGKLPLLVNTETHNQHIVARVKELIVLSKDDWDSFETSWDFQLFPWLTSPLKADKTEQSFNNWETHCTTQIKRMQELETENNRLFIEAYGLQDELTPEIPEDQITLALADREADVRRLLSYAVGCMMGRYSLDEPGLIYAHSGNEGFDQSKYKSFPVDDDGIVPIMDMEWFDDDAAVRFENFIKVAWTSPSPRPSPMGGEGVLLEDNLKFISESLSAKKGEAPRDTIRRYFSSSFFKDHLKTYKKRPIYWLFSSGKLKAFECLVYLHRYNESTLSRMRNEYVTPLQGKFSARADYLQNEIDSAASASERNKLQKQLDMLSKKQAELRSFDDELRHYADQRIRLDLDNGVKVNYGKFGNLLAEVNTIIGKKKR